MKDSTRHPIDELFRNKLNEDQPVSEDSLWEEVEGIMDNRKKKKRFFIFMISLLVMLSGTTAYFLIPNNKAGISTYTVVTPPQKQVTGQTSIGSEKMIEDNKHGAESVNSPGNSVNNPQKEEVASASHSSLSITSAQSKSAIKTHDNLSTRTSINNNTGKAFSIGKHSAFTVSKNHKSSNSDVQASIASTNKKKGLNNNTSSDQPISEALNADLATSPSGTANDTNNAGKTDANVSQALWGDPAVVKNEVDDNSSKKPDVDQADQSSKPKKPTHKSLMKWFVEVDGAYIDNIHLISAPTGVTPNYNNIRGSDEKPLATFNYMLKVGVVRKNVKFNTGLGIANVGEKVEYKNHNDTTGNPIIKNGTVFERNGKYINQYVTVPLQVAYLIPVKGVRFQLGIGTAASIPVRWTSYYLNQQVDGLEDPGSLKMVNNIVLNLSMTFGLEVPFTRHWAGIASFDYSRDVSNVFKSSYGIRQEYIGVGGNLGIRYSFAR